MLMTIQTYSIFLSLCSPSSSEVGSSAQAFLGNLLLRLWTLLLKLSMALWAKEVWELVGVASGSTCPLFGTLAGGTCPCPGFGFSPPLLWTLEPIRNVSY